MIVLFSSRTIEASNWFRNLCHREKNHLMPTRRGMHARISGLHPFTVNQCHYKIQRIAIACRTIKLFGKTQSCHTLSTKSYFRLDVASRVIWFEDHNLSNPNSQSSDRIPIPIPWRHLRQARRSNKFNNSNNQKARRVISQAEKEDQFNRKEVHKSYLRTSSERCHLGNEEE